MRKPSPSRKLSRREFLKLSGWLLSGAAANHFIPKSLGESGELTPAAVWKQVSPAKPDIHLAVCDGWIHLPGQLHIPWTGVDPARQYVPAKCDPSGNLATDLHRNKSEPGLNTYIFGFRDVTGMSEELIHSQKMSVQASAPLFWVNQEQDYFLALSNLGLPMCPDRVNSHTVHWHGICNAYTPFVDEPQPSLAIPIGQTLALHYKPHNPGTHMYHCYFEQTEQAPMSMTGTVFVRPIQDGNTALYPSGKYAYNDGDGSTGFDREFAFTLTDIWSEAITEESHQLPDWADFGPQHFLLNGRVYPDTLVGNGGEDVDNPWGHDGTTGDLLPPGGRPDLRYQPLTSLVEANSGERILLRFANLSFQQHAMTITGLKMKVIGRDATLLRGRHGADLTYKTNTISIGIGQSCDVIIKAPEVTIETKFLLYNCNNNRLQKGGRGYGGQMTEIRIHPAGKMAQQIRPNTNPYI